MDNRVSRPPPRGERQASHRVPANRTDRDRLRATAERWVAEHGLLPPLSMEETRACARRILIHHGLPAEWEDFAAVMVGNAVWRDTVAGIPYDRRIILLPQCLRPQPGCPATTDALGVLCQQCGRCPIGGLQALAEQLGYLVLVAEGASVVTRLIESGQVDAVIGVSCLTVLERAFPHLAAAAVPSLAVPLLRDGCRDSALDLDWVVETIRLRSDGGSTTETESLRREVAGWFEAREIERLMGPASSSVERLARDWLARGGKRWRPFLVAATWRALTPDGRPVPDMVRSLAAAVECFHKASLIHDDIEDGDATRYGRPTLHREHGVPIAINVGDALVGEGYRRIAECGAPPEGVAAMLRAATEGHRALCVGQGEELAWLRSPEPWPAARVLEVFRLKTAPAFEVALRLGLCAAGNGRPAVEAALRDYSAALGIAYQIRDDLDDLDDPPARNGAAPAPVLSILNALAWEAAAGPQRDRVVEDWCRPADAAAAERLTSFVRLAGVPEKARLLLDHHRNAAIRAMEPVQDVHLRGLLRRIASRLFPRI